MTIHSSPPSSCPTREHRASAQPTRASIQCYWTMFHKNVYMYKPPKMAATQLGSNRTQTNSAYMWVGFVVMALSLFQKYESEGQYQITLSCSFIHAFGCNDIYIYIYILTNLSLYICLNRKINSFFMFEFPWIITLYYIKNQQMQLWQYCLLVTAKLLYMFRTLSASIIRSTKNCRSSHWCMTWVGRIYIQ